MAVIVSRGVIGVTLAIATIFGNVLTSIAILRFKKLRTVASNYFILSLSISDITYAFGTVNLTAFGFANKAILVQRLKVAFAYFPYIISSELSILTLFMMTIDRLIAVWVPFTYKKMVTTKTAKLAVFCVWMVILCTVGVTILYHGLTTSLPGVEVLWIPHAFLVYSSFFIYIYVGIIAFMYCAIFCKIKSQSRKVRSTNSDNQASYKQGQKTANQNDGHYCLFYLCNLVALLYLQDCHYATDGQCLDLQFAFFHTDGNW